MGGRSAVESRGPHVRVEGVRASTCLAAAALHKTMPHGRHDTSGAGAIVRERDTGTKYDCRMAHWRSRKREGGWKML